MGGVLFYIKDINKETHMPFVKAAANINHNLKVYAPGDVLEVTDVEAAQLIKSGSATKFNPPETKAPEVKETDAPKPVETKAPQETKAPEVKSDTTKKPAQTK